MDFLARTGGSRTILLADHPSAPETLCEGPVDLGDNGIGSNSKAVSPTEDALVIIMEFVNFDSDVEWSARCPLEAHAELCHLCLPQRRSAQDAIIHTTANEYWVLAVCQALCRVLPAW